MCLAFPHTCESSQYRSVVVWREVVVWRASVWHAVWGFLIFGQNLGEDGGVARFSNRAGLARKSCAGDEGRRSLHERCYGQIDAAVGHATTRFGRVLADRYPVALEPHLVDARRWHWCRHLRNTQWLVEAGVVGSGRAVEPEGRRRRRVVTVYTVRVLLPGSVPRRSAAMRVIKPSEKLASNQNVKYKIQNLGTKIAERGSNLGNNTRNQKPEGLNEFGSRSILF